MNSNDTDFLTVLYENIINNNDFNIDWESPKYIEGYDGCQKVFDSKQTYDYYGIFKTKVYLTPFYTNDRDSPDIVLSIAHIRPSGGGFNSVRSYYEYLGWRGVTEENQRKAENALRSVWDVYKQEVKLPPKKKFFFSPDRKEEFKAKFL